MKIKYLLIATITLIAISCTNKTDKKNLITDSIITSNIKDTKISENIYAKAGVITVKDPMLARLGVKNDSLETISLMDISKFTGFICPGLTTGFYMFRDALDSLYPNGEVPMRGQIQFAISRPSDLTNVASYITGARGCMGGRSEINKNDAKIDTSLKTQKGILTIILKRKDTGKMVKAVFYKKNVLKEEDRKLILELKEKVFSNTANKDEQLEFKNNIRRIIKDIIDNGVYENSYTISDCTEYKF